MTGPRNTSSEGEFRVPRVLMRAMRISVEENEAWKEEAAHRGCSVSAYLRDSANGNLTKNGGDAQVVISDPFPVQGAVEPTLTSEVAPRSASDPLTALASSFQDARAEVEAWPGKRSYTPDPKVRK